MPVTIKEAKESVVQVVRSEVESSDPDKAIEIAELPHVGDEFDWHERLVLGDTADELDSPKEGGRFKKNFESTSIDGIDLNFDEPDHLDFGVPASPSAWFQQRYGSALDPALAPFGSIPHMHYDPIFGSMAITSPWVENMRVTGLSTQHWDNYAGVEILSSAQAQPTQELHSVQLRFRLRADEPVGHVLTIKSPQGRNFCCILPSDVQRRTFLLEIDVQDDDYIRFSAYLSSDNEGTTGSIAECWDRLRALDPSAAARHVISSGVAKEFDHLFRNGNEALREKIRAPLAATVAGVLLLKCIQFDRMHDWARNVGNWFPSIPDGVIVWTEQCRRLSADVPTFWFVQELSQRSLPFTSDGFGIAVDLLTDIVRGRFRDRKLVRDAADTLLARYETTARYFRDAGMFSSYVGWPDGWTPGAVLGPRR